MSPQAIIDRSPEMIRRLTDPALRAMVLAMAAALTLRLLRVRNVSAQLAVWTGVLYAALVLPLLGWLLPALPLRVPAGGAMTAVKAVQTDWLSGNRQFIARLQAGHLARAVRAARTLCAEEAKAAVRSRPVRLADLAVSRGKSFGTGAAPGAVTPEWSRSPDSSGEWLPFGTQIRSTLNPMSTLARTAVLPLVVYIIVVAFLLARVCVGLVLSLRLRRSAAPIRDPGAVRWLEWHALAMGLDRVPVLAESESVSVPLTLGVFRPTVLVPRGWREWESAKLSAVIAHELSHVRRKDTLTRALSLIYRNALWFSPLGWWLERRLEDLAEQASDAATVRAGADPIYYAEVLMGFFGTVSNGWGRVNLYGVAIARGTRAQRRIENVLTLGGKSLRRLKASVLVLAALCAAPLVYLTAATHPVLVGQLSSISSASAAQEPPEAQPAPTAHAVPAEAPVTPASPSPAARGAGAMPGPLPALPPVLAAPTAAPVRPVAPGHPVAAPDPQSLGTPKTGDWQDDDNNWILTDDHEGMNYAIVKGKSVIVSGSEDDRDTVRLLQKKTPGDFIWFVHNGESYLIRDSATVKTAQALYEPMEELGKKQAALGKQQEEFGRQQEAIGREMEKVRVQVPLDLEARLKKVEATIKEIESNATQEDLGRLQGELGDIQGEIGNLQGKAGAQQGRIGARMGELGAKRGELGRQQGELGREQGRIARQASRQIQDILKHALANGSAQRAPQ